MKIFIRILLTIVCLALLAGMVDSVILSGITQGTMAELVTAYARVRGHDGITPADYPEIAAEIITYLKTGREEDLPEIRGERLFTERENLHLKDCSGIIRGMMTARTVFICLLVVFAAVCIFLKFRDGGRAAVFAQTAAGSMAAACMVLFGAFLALTVWGLVNFDGLFITFHRVFFHNDLWILDPSQDLMIQLMPYAFFEKYAGRILVSLIPCLGIMLLFPALYIRLMKKAAPAS